MKKKIDQNAFRAVKIMTKGGATIEEIANFLQVGPATVSRIRASETLEEYNHKLCLAAMECKARNKEKAAKQAAKEAKSEPVQAPVQEPVKVVPPPQSPVANGYINNRILEELKVQNEFLKLISNKLAFIVEQLA